MTERIGYAPKFDLEKIKDPAVRGFVHSAYRYALDPQRPNQQKPSEAVKEFCKELGTLNAEEFEKKYGVSAARIKSQLSRSDRAEFLNGVKTKLKVLYDEFLAAENYWNEIFGKVIKKYFKEQESEIHKALETSHWYPYLKILWNHDPQITLNQQTSENGDDTYSLILYLMPSDKQQIERTNRLYAHVTPRKCMWGSLHYAGPNNGQVVHDVNHWGGGWIYLCVQNYFINKDCAPYLLFENIQQPKITPRGKPIIKVPDEIVNAEQEIFDNAHKGVQSTTSEGNGEFIPNFYMKLSNLLFNKLFYDTERKKVWVANPEHLLGHLIDLQQWCNSRKSVAKANKDETFKRLWKVSIRWINSMVEHVKDYLKTQKQGLMCPQSLYPIDFLPAFLVSICFLKEFIADKKGILFETSVFNKNTKKQEDYKKLLGALDAKKAEFVPKDSSNTQEFYYVQVG